MYKFVVLLVCTALVLGVPVRKPEVPHLDGKIVGGESVKIEDYPYQVQLELVMNGINMFYCGGSTISNKYVVTAAHCTEGMLAVNFLVRAGSSIVHEGGVVAGVSKIHQHPKYDPKTADFDISILELKTELTFGPGINKIDLLSSDLYIMDGTEAVTSGWGALAEGGSNPKELQAVKVPIVNIEKCKQAYANEDITERMICAGYPEGGKDTCQGDSGGPLVVEGMLVGVVSWGHGCARPNNPGVYSSVSNLREFIREVTGI